MSANCFRPTVFKRIKSGTRPRLSSNFQFPGRIFGKSILNAVTQNDPGGENQTVHGLMAGSVKMHNADFHSLCPRPGFGGLAQASIVSLCVHAYADCPTHLLTLPTSPDQRTVVTHVRLRSLLQQVRADVECPTPLVSFSRAVAKALMRGCIA